MIGHIAGVPAEELLPLLYGAGGLLAAARAYAQSPFASNKHDKYERSLDHDR